MKNKHKIGNTHWLLCRAVIAAGFIFDIAPKATRLGADLSVPSETEILPIRAPFPMPQLDPPTFPLHTEDVRNHGAIADGKSLNTKAFAAAIAACADAGGGRVLIPAGRWLTGPIHLQSNINLHVEKGAEILFSTNLGDYLPVVFSRAEGFEVYSRSPLVYANGCTNIAITGKGVLVGQGEAWWFWRKYQREAIDQLYRMVCEGVPVDQRILPENSRGLRPSFIQTINCTNVLMDGFTITSGPFWTIHPVYSQNVIIRNVTLITRGLNNDGIDVDSSRDVLIEHCRFDTGDDAIAIKSGQNEDGWRVARPSENIVIRYCRFGTGKRRDSVLSIGSDMSGDVRNVYVHDCSFDLTEQGIRLKSMRGRGGIVENVWIENISMGRISGEPIVFDMLYAGATQANTKKPPLFRNIHFKNIKCEEALNAGNFIGLPESPIENVTFENYEVKSVKGLKFKEVTGLTLTNVRILADKPPAITLVNGRDVEIRNSPWSHELVPFLWLEGARSRNIRLDDVHLPYPDRQLIFGKDVPIEVVKELVR